MTVATVAASEDALIALARAIVTAEPGDAEPLWELLTAERTLPPQIGPACASLLGDALARSWLALWRRGDGASRARLDVAGAGIRVGRPWDGAAQALAFSPATLTLLRWLVATPLLDPSARAPRLPDPGLTLGDGVVIYLVLDAVRDTALAPQIAAQPLVAAAPLAWLAVPDVLARAHPAPVLPDFAPLCTARGAAVLEALGPRLASDWRALTLAAATETDPAALVALGRTRDAVLGAFFEACDRSGRRDLAGFVVDAAAPLLARAHAPAPGRLDPTTPLGVRAAARLAAGTLWRAVERWRRWDEQHRGVRFFDDDYPVAQLLLARFEPVGSRGADQAAAWLADLAALAPAPPAPAASATIPAEPS